jgi:hypothetical protein
MDTSTMDFDPTVENKRENVEKINSHDKHAMFNYTSLISSGKRSKNERG